MRRHILCISANANTNQAANTIGAEALHDFVAILALSVGYGIFVPISLLSMKVLWNRRFQADSAKWLLAVIILMFLLTSGQPITVTANAIALFSFSGNTADVRNLSDRLVDSNIAAYPYETAKVFCQALNFIAGDAIVVWRATILWSNNRAVQVLLWGLLAISAGISFWDFGRMATSHNHCGAQNIVALSNTIDAASMFVSFGVNLIATLFIVFKAWDFYGTSVSLAQNDRGNNKPSAYKILVLVIECGVAFCVCQLIFGVITLILYHSGSNPLGPVSLAYAVIGPACAMFAGMYPPLVVLIVGMQKSSIDNSTFITHNTSGPVASHGTLVHGRGSGKSHQVSNIRFARAQTTTVESEPTTMGGTPSTKERTFDEPVNLVKFKRSDSEV